MGDSHPGLQARLMSQALRKLSGAIKASNTAMVFTNQLRHKIGVMFGSPETTSGGMALKFYASVRMDIRRIQAIKASGEVIGNRTRVRVKKNKVAPPFRECEFDIMYNEGISKEGDVLDLGVEMDLIEKRGSFYSYEGERLAQGRENAKQWLRDNPARCFEIENVIRRESGMPELDLSPAFDLVDEPEFAESETVEVEEGRLPDGETLEGELAPLPETKTLEGGSAPSPEIV
jgi:recombination protein RecA